MSWSSEQTGQERLTRARVVDGALRQAARHERALHACLAELGDRGVPSDPRTAAIPRRARRHADRALGLARLAAKLNGEAHAAPFLAATLERIERDRMLVDRWCSDEDAPVGEAA